MSETIRPTEEMSNSVPGPSTSRKAMSPWLLGCGVLAMALFALGVLATVVAGILMFAVRTEQRPLPIRTESAVATQSLPDGSLLVLEQVTHGRQHDFDGGFRESSGGSFSGPPSASPIPTRHTPTDTMVVWFTQWDAAKSQPMSFDWFQRCAAVDVYGNEIDNIDKGRFAFYRSGGSSSEHGSGTGPFSRLSGGPYDKVVTYFGLPAFRHKGDKFTLRFYDTQNRKVAEIQVPNPRSSMGIYPEWEPESLPITKTDGDVSLTLTAMTAQVSESARTINGVQSKETRIRVNPVLVTKSLSESRKGDLRSAVSAGSETRADHGVRIGSEQAGKITSDWNTRSYSLFDALGNESSVWDCKLSPHESAWQLVVKAWRSDTAAFDPSEIWTHARLSVPEAQQIEYVNKTKTLDQATVTLVALGGPGKLSYPGLPAAHRGGYSSSGRNYFGQGNKRRQANYEIEVENNRMTVESEVPYLVVQVSGLFDDQRIALRVKDDSGAAMETSGPRTVASSFYLWFMDLPETTKAINAELVVHACRTFDFLVAPPSIPSTQPREPSRSPRSDQRRMDDARRAIDNGRRLLAAGGENGDALNNLAWAIVTAPEELRDAEQAVAYAERAVQMEPGNSNYINTLGTAYYRAGKYDAALSQLENNAGTRTDTLVLFDLYPLAMTRFRLEQAGAAQETYQRAIDLHHRLDADLSLTHWQELYDLRIEAASLLLGEPPQEVFDRAGQRARQGKWEPAAAEFAKALEIYPIDHWQWYRSGALLAYLDRAEEYRNHCRRMLDRFGDTNDPFIAERVGKLSLLLPDAEPSDSRPAQLCDKSVNLRPDVSWFQLASAIAKYRAGQFQDALTQLESAEAQVGDQVYCRVLVELFRAMSLHHVGQQEPALRSLESAASRLGDITPKSEGESLDYGTGWHDHLMCEVVRREAESLLRVDSTR